MTTSAAQRKAAADHRKKRVQDGWRQKAFLMPPDVIEALPRQAKAAGLSEAQHLFALVRAAEGVAAKAEAPKRAPVAKVEAEPVKARVKVGDLLSTPPGAKLR